jgi:hypothetical protein
MNAFHAKGAKGNARKGRKRIAGALQKNFADFAWYFLCALCVKIASCMKKDDF